MNEWKNTVCAHVDSIKDRLLAVSQDIFDHPELKFEEVRAAQVLADEL